MKKLARNLGARIKNLFIAVDQLAYVVITLGAGNPDETCSSAAWRLECDKKFFGFFRPVIDTVFFWEPNHCEMSHRKEALKKPFVNSRYFKK